MRRSRLILCCLAIHAARYSLSAVLSTSLLSLWISCFSDATYSRSCFRWWARVWMSGFTIFTSSHRQRGKELKQTGDKMKQVNGERKCSKSSNNRLSINQTNVRPKSQQVYVKAVLKPVSHIKVNLVVMDTKTPCEHNCVVSTVALLYLVYENNPDDNRP